MLNISEFAKPKPIKFVIFFVLYLFTPMYGSISRAFIDEFGLTVMESIIFPSLIKTHLFLLFLQLNVIIVFSFAIGELLSRIIPPTKLQPVITKALVWSLGTLTIAYSFATIMGTGSIYWAEVLINLLKWTFLAFCLATALELLKSKTQNKNEKTIATVMFILILVMIAFLEIKVSVLPFS